MLKLYNNLSRKKEIFKPLAKNRVGFYSCGPTVYWYAHIGNLRTYLFEDILKRVLEYNGYKVKHVMNITDVGHLTSDADSGDDKIELGAKREKKTAWQIAQFYEKAFKKDLKLLNIEEPNVWIKATETITEQIKLIKELEKKGFTYKISDGIYFDSSKLPTYGRLWPKKMKIKAGARIEMVAGKKNPTDFALWKFTPAGVKRQMEWDSPWGRGFPGWHTECVVMSAKNLGIPFDIHSGGIDHIPIHHTNEIAQSEAAYEKVLAKYWLHGDFLILPEGKMAKSKGNIIRLDDLTDKGFNPLAYRYLCLNAHYRSKLNFSFEALKSSQNSLENLYDIFSNLKSEKSKLSLKSEYKNKFLELINNDLDTPKALALFWNLAKNKNISDQEKKLLFLDFDRVFGLGLAKLKKEKTPSKIIELVRAREEFRKKGDFTKADEMREKLKEAGYWVEDTKKGSKIKKNLIRK